MPPASAGFILSFVGRRIARGEKTNRSQGARGWSGSPVPRRTGRVVERTGGVVKGLDATWLTWARNRLAGWWRSVVGHEKDLDGQGRCGGLNYAPREPSRHSQLIYHCRSPKAAGLVHLDPEVPRQRYHNYGKLPRKSSSPLSRPILSVWFVAIVDDSMVCRSSGGVVDGASFSLLFGICCGGAG